MTDCEECGFSYDALSVPDAIETLRGFGKRYRIPLTRGLKGEDLDALVRAHPFAGTWSALEYACHVRDVFEVQRGRLAQAMIEDGFRPEPMGREERVVTLRYNEQDPQGVSLQIDAFAEALASDLDAFQPPDWERTMVYNYPEPQSRPLSWVAVHTVHEGEHHLLDVGRVLRAARGR